MSLRARLLVGMAVVGVVLVVAAVVITRSTESYLVERVDAQLAAARSSVQGGGFERGGPGGPGCPMGEKPGGNLNTLYVGTVDGDAIQTRATAGFHGPRCSRPRRQREPSAGQRGNAGE